MQAGECPRSASSAQIECCRSCKLGAFAYTPAGDPPTHRQPNAVLPPTSAGLPPTNAVIPPHFSAPPLLPLLLFCCPVPQSRCKSVGAPWK